jgi:Fur family transcriptional regulator, ferric uptake regulator
VESQDIKKAGLKITLPRVKVLEILEECSDRHLSAEDVYKALLKKGEDIGLATVYRVLTQFEAAHLVDRHHFEEGHSVFELSQAGHHDHIVCIDCGRVEEFFDTVIEQRQKEISAAMGFEIADHSLYLYGNCRKENCQHKK